MLLCTTVFQITGWVNHNAIHLLKVVDPETRLLYVFIQKPKFIDRILVWCKMVELFAFGGWPDLTTS